MVRASACLSCYVKIYTITAASNYGVGAAAIHTAAFRAEEATDTTAWKSMCQSVSAKCRDWDAGMKEQVPG